MVLKLDAKRRLSVPRQLAPSLPGDQFEAHFDPGEDTLIFRRLPARENWLAVLKQCPVCMDDIPSRSREYPRRRNS